MAATIIIVVIIIVIVLAVILNYRKKVMQGCCGAEGDAAEKVIPKDVNLSEYPYTCTIRIEGMTCKNCAARIENRFNQTDGFFAKVNLRKNSAEVRTKTPVEDGEIKSIVAKAGYHVTEVQRA
ncbi:MAG: heavy-metal-associated domain-containing protein [Lachnospiraceae bacterium]|nr:heavy-metal-associated domain-containing protein [Lachnospiraceae bacterium]